MARRRHELTDAQWEKITGLLPGKKSDPGRTVRDNRLFVDAVVFVLETGIPWADLPAASGRPTRSTEGLTAGARGACGNGSCQPWASRTRTRCNWTR